MSMALESIESSLRMPRRGEQECPSLEFRDGQCVVKMRMEGGTLVERLVSYEAVREAATGIPVDSGWLPPEVIRWGNGKLDEWCVAFIPPGRHRLEIETGPLGSNQVERIEASLPGLVLFGAGTKYWIWALRTPRFEDPRQALWRCPLPNVYQDGLICWGPLKPPRCSPRHIMRAWDLFIHSTFNAHAANGKSKASPEDVRSLLKTAPNQYPVEDLEPLAEPALSVDEAVKSFWQTGEIGA